MQVVSGGTGSRGQFLVWGIMMGGLWPCRWLVIYFRDQKDIGQLR